MLFSIKSNRGLTSIYQTNGNFLYTATSDYFSYKRQLKIIRGGQSCVCVLTDCGSITLRQAPEIIETPEFRTKPDRICQRKMKRGIGKSLNQFEKVQT